jgi:DNA repair protein RadC
LDYAQQLLARFDGWRGLLQTNTTELQRELGIGPHRAAHIRAALEVGRRLVLASVGERFHIRSPTDAASVLMAEMGYLDQEQLRRVLLTTKNEVQPIPTVYIGSLNSAVIRVGEVFKEAVRRNSAALIVAHNHPSSDIEPSAEDILVTRQIIDAGKLLDTLHDALDGEAARLVSAA